MTDRSLNDLPVSGAIREKKPPFEWGKMRLILFLSAVALFSVETSAKSRGPISDCKECPQLMLVHAGTFMMGSAEGEGDPDEHPRHEVKIVKNFMIGRFEVTRGDWQRCVDAVMCSVEPLNCKVGEGCPSARVDRAVAARHPVVNLLLSDIRAYLGWLSDISGKAFRLPTEAEWEFAARAGTETRYYFGDTFQPEKSNADTDETKPVGSFPPNRFGLFDMAGNVWEVVESCFDEQYQPGRQRDKYKIRETCQRKRSVRGGSFANESVSLRSANRGGSWELRDFTTGFRVVREAD